MPRSISMPARHHLLHPVLALCAVLAATTQPARAQEAPDRASVVAMRTEYLSDLDTLQTKFLALANAIPADKYSWRPAPGVRSIGEVFMHVASEWYVYVPISYGAERSPVVGKGEEAFKKFESASTKPDVLKHLKEGFAYGRAAVANLDPAQLTGKRKLFGQDITIFSSSLGMADDLHEHLGQLIAYARVNGVKPPWSK